MTIQTKWYDEQKTAILMTILSYEPTWVAFHAAIDEVNALAKTVNHDIIVILDPHDHPVPKAERPIPHLRKVLANMPPNAIYAVTVLGKLGRFEESIGKIFANIMFKDRVKLVNTL